MADITGRKVRSSDDMAGVWMDWARQNSRVLMLGLGVAFVTVLGVYLYVRSGQIKETRAAQRYENAERLAATGKPDEGVRELREVSRRYGGTSAGTLAALRLARMSMEQRKFRDAIQILDEARNSSDMEIFGASIYGLLGAAKSDSGLAAEAAQDYLKAAEATKAEREKNLLTLRAAEVYARGDRKDDAIRLFKGLAGGPPGDIRDRALIRLGELQATPAKPGAGT